MPERWLSLKYHHGVNEHHDDDDHDHAGEKDGDGGGGEKNVSESATRLTRDFWGFGGGRRICIGYKAAQTALFLPFARLVMCFDFEKTTDFDDTKVNSWNSEAPFPVAIRKRKEKEKIYEDLILSAVEKLRLPPSSSSSS